MRLYCHKKIVNQSLKNRFKNCFINLDKFHENCMPYSVHLFNVQPFYVNGSTMQYHCFTSKTIAVFRLKYRYFRQYFLTYHCYIHTSCNDTGLINNSLIIIYI